MNKEEENYKPNLSNLTAGNIDTSTIEVKKYNGYGYHGGGRPRKDAEARRVTISISGTPTEIAELKKRAADAGLNVSRFVLDNLTK